jgi:hypothetical protein
MAPKTKTKKSKAPVDPRSYNDSWRPQSVEPDVLMWKSAAQSEAVLIPPSEDEAWWTFAAQCRLSYRARHIQDTIPVQINGLAEGVTGFVIREVNNLQGCVVLRSPQSPLALLGVARELDPSMLRLLAQVILQSIDEGAPIAELIDEEVKQQLIQDAKPCKDLSDRTCASWLDLPEKTITPPDGEPDEVDPKDLPLAAPGLMWTQVYKDWERHQLKQLAALRERRRALREAEQA